MLIDSSNCIGCKACIVACKQENSLGAGNKFITILPREYLRDHFVKYYAHLSCKHCYEPQCVAACPYGAIKRNEDGVVLHDELKCVGCQVCVTVCRHSAIKIMQNGIVGKCNLCQDRSKLGLPPACVSVCPTNARIFDSKEKILQIAGERQAELESKGYKPQLSGIQNSQTKVVTLYPQK